MSDIKVDKAIKDAEAELYELLKPEELPPEIPDWIVREQEHIAQALKAHNKKIDDMKKYFKSLGLPWDKNIAEMIDPNSSYPQFGISSANQLEEFKENANKLASWFKKSTTKLGDII